MLKKMIAAASLVLMLGQAQLASAYDANLQPYPDVSDSDWAKEAVYSLTALGHLSGYPDGSFRPDAKVTREAFIKMLVTALQLDDKPQPQSPQNEAPITDVPQTKWSYPYIEKAYGNHLIDFMISSGSFSPEKPIRRDEVAAAVGAALFQQEPEANQTAWLSTDWKREQTTHPFSDQKKMNPAAAPYLYLAVSQGILQGDAKGTFRPEEPLSRKEAAAVVYRLINQETAQQPPLKLLGFYAVKSYPNAAKIPQLDQVDFGWSHLDYDGKGAIPGLTSIAGPSLAKLMTTTIQAVTPAQAQEQAPAPASESPSIAPSTHLNLSEGEWAIPDGWEEVTSLAQQAHGPSDRELMIFADNQNAHLENFLNDPDAQQTVIQEALDQLDNMKYGFTGICIDFEGLKDAKSSAPYVAFLQKLKAALGSRTLTVAVPPTFYYKGYDLKAIGETVDYMVLMAYDFTHVESRLPSAPLPLVNETVAEAVKVVPKEKLLLGISKQANQWVDQQQPSQPSATQAQTQTQYFEPAPNLVEDRLKQPGTTQTMDEPYFLQKIQFQDARGKHVIYYENTESIAKKLWLARVYGLRGVALWQIGSFTEADWQLFSNQP